MLQLLFGQFPTPLVSEAIDRTFAACAAIALNRESTFRLSEIRLSRSAKNAYVGIIKAPTITAHNARFQNTNSARRQR
jgi:hypothetical protein